STAEATIALGTQNIDADVAYEFALVSGDGLGNSVSDIDVGDRFGIEISAKDLRVFTSTFVFAGFLDLLYDSDHITPANTRPNDSFDFDVDFHGDYSEGAAVGSSAVPGIIDEFGTLFSQATVPPSSFSSLNPGRIATIYFNAVAPGTANVIGSPADNSPFQDTLLFNVDDPIDRSLLKFEILELVIGAGAPNQNASFNLDVNDDGLVSPIDALLVINQMNRDSMSMEGEQTGNSGGKRYYTDVNGDNRTTALDALQVINYLKRANNSQGSGEQIALLSDSDRSLNIGLGSDAYFAELSGSNSGKIASFDSPAASGKDSSSTNDSDSSNEEEDIYNILADDVDGRWS
ncbi:MAG: dockerin type I domain-containing protein, partial [Rubripirellula sp.]